MADTAGGVANGHHAGLDVEGGAVLAVVDKFRGEYFPAGQCEAHAPDLARVALGSLQHGRRTTDGFLGGESGEAGECCIHKDNSRRRRVRRPGVCDDDRVVGVEYGGFEQLQLLCTGRPCGYGFIGALSGGALVEDVHVSWAGGGRGVGRCLATTGCA